MRRTGKLLYVPGLISLIGILIALPSFYKKVKPTKQYCLTLFMPTDCKKDFPIDYQFSKCYLEKEVKKKKQIKVTIDENKEANKKKLNLVRYEGLRLKFFEDTTTVILITLSDGSNYGEFVSILDMCEADGHKRYGSWDNKFVIWGEWPKKKTQQLNSTCLLCNDAITIKQPASKPNIIDLVASKIKQFYSPKGLYLFLGWIVIVTSFLFFRSRLIKASKINTVGILN